MTEPNQTLQAGVVCPDDTGRPALQNYLERHHISAAKWYTPGELHNLEREVLAGRIRQIIFPGLPDLLEAIWEEEIVYEQWPADVRIDFVEPPGDTAINLTAASWRKWRHRHRRRQATAGAVLSAIVLAVSFLLCVLLIR